MSNTAGCFASIIGGILGAILVTILTPIWQSFFLPHVPGGLRFLHDGQYVFIIFYTIPQGVILGAITGWGVAMSLAQKLVDSAVLRVVGGLTILAYFMATGLLSASNGICAAVKGSFAFWGVPMLWSLALAISGVVSLLRQRNASRENLGSL